MEKRISFSLSEAEYQDLMNSLDAAYDDEARRYSIAWAEYGAAAAIRRVIKLQRDVAEQEAK